MGGFNIDAEAMEAPLGRSPEDVLLAGSLEIETPLSPEEQRSTLRLIQRRLLPICWCVREGCSHGLVGIADALYSRFSALLAYLDRANLSLAELQMNNDLNATCGHCFTDTVRPGPWPPCVVRPLLTRAAPPRSTASARVSSSGPTRCSRCPATC